MATPEQNIPTESSQEENSQTGGQATSQQQEVSEPTPDPWRGTRMEGRSPEEVRAYLSTLEQAVAQQREQINSISTQVPAQPQVERPQEKETDFFEDPVGTMERVMERQVAPLREQVQQFQAAATQEQKWKQAQMKLVAEGVDDFEQYRPIMENIVSAQGISPSQLTVPLIEHLYFTAVGMARKRGMQPSNNNPPPTQTPTTRTHIPQHRPSSAPPPQPTTPSTPQLTEAERKLARDFGMNPEEYKRLQEEDLTVDEFATRE